MRGSLIAGALAFALVEAASLAPVAQLATVVVEPKLNGAPNEAAIAWALTTREPYLDLETVRGFHVVALRGAGPEPEQLAAHLRNSLWVRRVGDHLELSVRARDAELASKAATFFGQRLQYFTRRPHGAMAQPRVEWLSYRAYVLRRELGLAPHADSSAPPPELNADERARVQGAGVAGRELLAVDEELRFWTAPLKPVHATDSLLHAPVVTAQRRFGTWPSHIVSFGVGLAFVLAAVLVRRILRDGARGATAAIAASTAAVPIVCGLLAGMVGFEARARLRVERHGGGSDVPLADQVAQSPQAFFAPEDFPELWRAEAVEPVAGAPALRQLAWPAGTKLRRVASGLEIAVARRDVLLAERQAEDLAQRMAHALRTHSALSWFRERARLPGEIRVAEGNVKMHEAALAAGAKTPELERLHRAKRDENGKKIEDAKLKIARIDAQPLPVDVVAVEPGTRTVAVLLDTSQRRIALLAIVVAASLVVATTAAFVTRKEKAP